MPRACRHLLPLIQHSPCRNFVKTIPADLSLPALLLVLLALVAAPPRAEAADELPSLGDAASGIMSHDAEFRLGRAWLRQLRAQAPVYYDPLVDDYLEHLVYRLASQSDIADTRFAVVLLNSREINAFAVPGGVLGFNAGLLLDAEREDEVASVVAHELAHLSQRHFARGLDRQRHQQPLTLTAILASILVAATVGGDAGAAALMGTQAGIAQSALAFSRDQEREADRVGMGTLARAGYNPEAMPAFFEQLERSSAIDEDRYPEFLRTHPVNPSRVSDARNRARQLPAAAVRRDALDHALARVRVQVGFARDPSASVAAFDAALRQAPAAQRDPLRYGLALARLRADKPAEALATLEPLRKADPDRIAYLVSEGDILLALDRVHEAALLFEQALRVAPDNFPLVMTAAQAWLRDNRAADAANLLARQAERRPEDPQVWLLLARTRGESGDAVGVHAARAEYLFLLNNTDQAIDQLQFGIEKAGDDFPRAAPLRNRVREMESMRKDYEP